MKSLLALFLSLCAFSGAHAYDPLAVDEKTGYVPPEESWKEDAVTVPEQFDPQDLQPFTLKGDSDRFDYAIERKSLHTGVDGVTRFVVVIRSDQGAVNSSYEGLRCGHREYKVYAYGSGQGLTPLHGSEWQPIPRSTDGYRAILYNDLICNLQTGRPNPPDSVFSSMRSSRWVDAPFINSGRD